MTTQPSAVLLPTGGQRIKVKLAYSLREGITACRVGDVYFFNTNQANYWVDITDAIEKKLEARHCHVSQHLNDDYLSAPAGLPGPNTK